MELTLLDVNSAQKDNKDYVEFYGHDEEGSTYGPVRVYMGKLYISKPLHYTLVKPLVDEYREKFGNCNTQPYGAKSANKFVLWVRTFDEDHDELIWREHDKFLEQTPTLQYVRQRMHYPEHKIKVKTELKDALTTQSLLHHYVNRTHEEIILPLLAAGMTQEDSLRWFDLENKTRENLAKRIKSDKEKRIASYHNVLDEDFFRDISYFQEELDNKVNYLEKIVKKVDPNDWVQCCWQKENRDSQNPWRTIIYLENTEGIKSGIARLFG
jgi:hypothetical protein